MLLLSVTLTFVFFLIQLAQRTRMWYVEREMMPDRNFTCLTPSHLNFEWQNVIYTNKTSLFWPKILKLGGDAKKYRERSTLCDRNSEPVWADRYENVYISYYNNPFTIFESRMFFVGQESICVQHMIDYLQGTVKCGELRKSKNAKSEL
jgi:peptide deformylase